nr:phosphotransferase [uncultured Flavobacterium sp.]
MNTPTKTILETYFDLDETTVTIHPIEEGYINTTFLIECNQGNSTTERYILQRINKTVFKNFEVIMNTMVIIAQHLKSLNYPKAILEPIPNKNGHLLSYDNEGYPWRLLPYIPNSKCINTISLPSQAFEAGKTFSEFYSYLWTIDTSKIKAAIPDFLDFEARIINYKLALRTASEERKTVAKKELEFLNEKIDLPNHLINLQKEAQLPMRIIHADPKISNILFDFEEKNTVGVIDLDTLMIGTLLYDYGDMVRSYTNNKKEDDPSNDNVFNKDICNSLKKGFLYHLNDKLSAIEKENLDYGAQVIIYIQALRFMTDFLNNDTYYKTEYPHQNLNRTKNQINLLSAILA